MKTEIYTHPLIVDGTRYIFSKNPFEYAKEYAVQHMPDRYEKLLNEEYGKAMDAYIPGISDPEPNREKIEGYALARLSTEFLKDRRFLEHYKQDGFSYVVDYEYELAKSERIALGLQEQTSPQEEKERDGEERDL